jgi:hypothetical protein
MQPRPILGNGSVQTDPLPTRSWERVLTPLSAIDWRGNKNNSDYEALSIALKRSFFRGFLLSVNYLWSHEIDDGSNGSEDVPRLILPGLLPYTLVATEETALTNEFKSPPS